MLTTAPTALLTAEEFALLPDPADGSQQELVKGVIITMPPPGFYHGLCCHEINFRLGKHVRESKAGFVTCNDSGIILARNPDTVRGPDIAFFSHERLPEPPKKGYPSAVPDLVAEVLSPSDVFFQVQLKVHQYHKAGVRLVWVLVPEDRSVAVFPLGKASSILMNGDVLSGEDVLPGFSCPVAELFP